MRLDRLAPALRTARCVTLVVLLTAACTTDDQATDDRATVELAIAPTDNEPMTNEAAVAPAATTPPRPTTHAPTTGSPLRSRTPLALDADRFSSSIEELDTVVLERIVGSSWTEGCPLALDRLRYVEVTHRTNDGGAAIGELVVDASVADDVVALFDIMFDTGFPIESMRLVDDFGADDLRSMQANNTSAFNCRFVTGTSNWSWHAFGRAIDINPLVNPYVTAAGIEPPEGAAYADRTRSVPGMLHADDVITTAFERLGWDWGGRWTSGQDYQHFDHADD